MKYYVKVLLNNSRSIMNWLDRKYVMLISGRLERFKQVGSNYRFRCNVCGDSVNSKTKTRGWFLSHQDKTRFFCHNCNTSWTFKRYLKEIDPVLHMEYVKDWLVEKSGEEKIRDHPAQILADKMKTPLFIKTTELNKIKKISQLKDDHPAKLYIISRMIPSEMHYKLFYAPKFKSFVNSIIPDKFKDVRTDEPRLIIPFLDEKKNLFGFQGRSFKKNDPTKYITIMLDSSKPKIYGLDDLNTSSKAFVTEGPIDAMFIKNGLASCGGRIDSNLKKLTSLNKDNIVIVYDNEPRSPHTIQKMERAIDDGYSLVIWPETLRHKDINDMIMNGASKDQIQRIIDNRTFSGLEAKLEMMTWKRT